MAKRPSFNSAWRAFMTARLRTAVLFASLILLVTGAVHARTDSTEASYSRSPIENYSQKTLLKNWALSVCLASIAKDPASKEDAGATASAYLEFGKQQIEAYDQLRKLVHQYVSRKYGGSIQSEFNTMKCIDLFHSKELDRLTTKLVKFR